jgi:hypothetical protein
MAHSNTIINQIAAFFPRHDFEQLAKIYHKGQKFRSFNRWSQFLAMMIGQLSGRKSLRDLVSNIRVQGRRIYHLGMKPTSKSTLARVNERQPYQLYRDMFFKLSARCKMFSPKHRFEFCGKIYLLDTTTIDLCLAVFPWASFRKAKGAVKLHFGLDADGYLPAFMNMTDGKKHEVDWAKTLTLHPGACVVFDRGFTDYSWYQQLTNRKITFVTRLKRNAIIYRFGNRRPTDSSTIKSDQKIKLKGQQADFRLIDFVDPDTGKEYQFLTNSLTLKATEVAALYKERWQIELFFKWIKQNLKVKTFFGTSRNAVLTQLWIALCVYLLLSFLKFKAKLGASLSKILRVLQLNLFERRTLMDLLKPPDIRQPIVSPQISMWN